ncbi:hypothetical protein [Planctomyces sp. SH-PL14]|uniref:hypothetical protein n=1 Tax=Planctomyces sp. SH-PL14 TaxID=1632864 RepID=UPI00078BB233|nr:hypothetical protein [Planctomyces sp. SH-PL14]AMV17225.1 hypothetical protein VT03_04990 [Planctomyces sp. SH-PL14]
MRTLRALWNDEAGFIISAELVLIATLCVLGLVVGMTLVRDAIGGEFSDIACALRSLDQSYSYSGFRAWKRCGYGCGTTKAYTAGSFFSQKGEVTQAEIVSFGDCRQVAPALPAAPAVETVPCAPVALPVTVPCPPPAAPTIECPPVTLPAPVVCPPAPIYCPTTIEVCPTIPTCPAPLYVPQ